jgi:hypothetical protein
VPADREHDYRRYYDDSTRELVARHFARDIALLGYDFDPALTPEATAMTGSATRRE